MREAHNKKIAAASIERKNEWIGKKVAKRWLSAANSDVLTEGYLAGFSEGVRWREKLEKRRAKARQLKTAIKSGAI